MANRHVSLHSGQGSAHGIHDELHAAANSNYRQFARHCPFKERVFGFVAPGRLIAAISHEVLATGKDQASQTQLTGEA